MSFYSPTLTLLKHFNLLLLVLHASVMYGSQATVHVWRSKNNFVESALSFHIYTGEHSNLGYQVPPPWRRRIHNHGGGLFTH